MALVVTGLLLSFLVLLLIASSASMFLIWKEQKRTKAALAEARANYSRAEVQRVRSETNFREAYRALEDILGVLDPVRSLRPLNVAELRQWQTETALGFLAVFCEQQSDDPSVRLQSGVAYVHSARVYQVLKKREETEHALGQAITVFRRLVKDFPVDPIYQRELADALGILAENLYLMGRVVEANANWSQAVRILRDAIRYDPSDFVIPTRLALALCCWMDPKLRDPTSAIRLARRAVEQAPHLPRPWLALGVASYRMGEWSASLDALQRAFQLAEAEENWSVVDRARPRKRLAGRGHLGPGSTPCALFFLAMARCQRGQAKEAIEAYDQAVREMESTFSSSFELDRFVRPEAAALLGVKELSKQDGAVNRPAGSESGR